MNEKLKQVAFKLFDTIIKPTIDRVEFYYDDGSDEMRGDTYQIVDQGDIAIIKYVTSNNYIWLNTNDAATIRSYLSLHESDFKKLLLSWTKKIINANKTLYEYV